MYLRTMTLTGSALFHAALVLSGSYMLYAPHVEVAKGKTSVAMFFQEQSLNSTHQQMSNVISNAFKKSVDLNSEHKISISKTIPNIKAISDLNRDAKKGDDQLLDKKQKEEEPKKAKVSITPNHHSEGIDSTRPQYKKNPAPIYPRRAILRNIEGDVLLLVSIDREGLPTEIVVQGSSGSRLLDHAAVKTVWEWSFIPAQREGHLINSKARIPVHFRIDQR